MTFAESFAILAAIWLAPHVTKLTGLTIGAVYMALSVIEVAIRLFK